MSGLPKVPVPKFGSFRPKTLPADDVSSVERAEKEQASKNKDEKVAKKRRIDRSRSRETRPPRSRGKDWARDLEKHQRHRSYSRDISKHEDDSRRHRSRSIEHKKGDASRSLKQDRREPFAIDRKGDIKIIEYGGNHLYDVPNYYRIGLGCVMGSSRHFKIDRDQSDNKKLVIADRRDFKSTRSKEKYSFSRVAKQKPRLLKLRSGLVDTSNEIELDFIPLSGTRGKKRKLDDSSDSENEQIDYRSVHGKAKAGDQPKDDDLQYATESDVSGSEVGRAIKPDEYVKQKTLELSRIVEQSPHDIDAWLALINHQDTLIRSGDLERRLTSAERQSTSEIKVHLYQKALVKATTLPDRERLLLGMMEEGSKFWETKTQAEKWKQISKDNIDSVLLWQSYLNFKKTTFSTFRYEDVRDVYIGRIKLLKETIKSGRSGRAIELNEQLVGVLLRLTVFMRESGYSELAIAIWQGLLELNVFSPVNLPPEEKFAKFIDFWEAELPRIGEQNALGWDQYANPKIGTEPPDPIVDPVGDLLDLKDIFRSWAKAERLRTRLSRCPGRMLDDIVEDDPFRIIIASDLEGFLVILPPELLGSLINAFLLFCGQPGLPDLTSLASREPCCSYRNPSELLLYGSAWVQNASLPAESDPHEGQTADISSIFKTRFANFAPSHEAMFTKSWFQSMQSWKDCYEGDNGPVPYSWFRSAMSLISKRAQSRDLTEYFFAFEWRNEPDSIKKIAKLFLKRHASSLVLYNAYGMIEWAQGNKEVGNGVFSAALNMASKMQILEERADTILLWKTWAWLSLEEQDNGTALRRLLQITDDRGESTTIGPANLLRVKQLLLASRDDCLSSGDTDHAVIYVDCQALLEYLSSTSITEMQVGNQGNITSALEVYTSFSETLVGRNLATAHCHEILLQSASRLIHHHAKIGPCKSAVIRKHMTSYLSYFPYNTIFLSLYEFNESRMRINRRVHNLLMRTVLTPENDTLTSRLFAIQYEINQATSIHSVRAEFEHAVSSPVSKGVPGLWKLYVLYCFQNFPNNAQDVWHRAFRACPWAKELYLVGFENKGLLGGFSELHGMWKIMGEKELRVHVDLEDLLEEIGHKQVVEGRKFREKKLELREK